MKKFNSKKVFYSTGSVLITVVFIAVVLLFNYVVSSLTDTFTLKYDLTQYKLHELSEDTIEFAKKVDKPINIYYFVDDVTITSGITETFESIAALNKNISYMAVSADKNPTLAQKFTTNDSKLNLYTVVVDNGLNFKTIPYESFYTFNPMTQRNDILVLESKVIAAINSLSREKVINVGFSTGHGEDSADVIKKYLKEDSMNVFDTTLATDDFMSRCDMLFIAAPVNDFTADEINRLDKYIREGGNVSLYYAFNAQAMPNLSSYLSECGIEVGNNVVFETESSKIFGNDGYIFSAEFTEHPITSNLIENANLNIVQLSRTVTPAGEYKNDFDLVSLQSTSDNGIAKNIATSEEEASGDLSLSVLAQYKNNGVTGSLLVSGSYVSYAGGYAEYNKDFVLSSIINATQPNETYNISPKLLWLERLNISQLNIVLWGLVLVFVFPAIIFIYGLFVWFRRRHL